MYVTVGPKAWARTTTSFAGHWVPWAGASPSQSPTDESNTPKPAHGALSVTWRSESRASLPASHPTSAQPQTPSPRRGLSPPVPDSPGIPTAPAGSSDFRCCGGTLRLLPLPHSLVSPSSRTEHQDGRGPRTRPWLVAGGSGQDKNGRAQEKGDGSEKHRPTLRVSPAAPLPQSLCSSPALCPSPAQLATPACNAPPPQEVRCGLLTEAPRTSGRCDALCQVRCSLSWSDDLRPSHPLNMKNSCFGGVRRKPILAPSILVHRWCSSRSAGQGREWGAPGSSVSRWHSGPWGTCFVPVL